MNARALAVLAPTHSRRGEQTRERIIRAARHLFASRGYRGTTVRDIAREARITDAAIYYHFADKDALLQVLICDDLAELRPAAAQIDAQTVPLHLALRTIAERAFALIDENADVMRIVLLEALAGNRQAKRRYQEWLAQWEARLTAVLQRFEDVGRLSRGESPAIARHAIGLLVFACEDALLLRPARNTSRQERRTMLKSFLGSALARLPEQLRVEAVAADGHG